MDNISWKLEHFINGHLATFIVTYLGRKILAESWAAPTHVHNKRLSKKKGQTSNNNIVVLWC